MKTSAVEGGTVLIERTPGSTSIQRDSIRVRTKPASTLRALQHACPPVGRSFNRNLVTSRTCPLKTYKVIQRRTDDHQPAIPAYKIFISPNHVKGMIERRVGLNGATGIPDRGIAPLLILTATQKQDTSQENE